MIRKKIHKASKRTRLDYFYTLLLECGVVYAILWVSKRFGIRVLLLIT